MKKTLMFSILCFLLFTLNVKAQIPPNAFNFSSVARNSAGQPIASTTIGIRTTILKTLPTGASQYSENHFVNTDQFGLFNLVIGEGTVQSGNMGAIDWSNDNYYLKIDMDTAGGTSFLAMGTTQLLSVPYALYAKSTGSVFGSGSFSHYIGEQFGGGVIFHLWKDSLGLEHGLIVDKTDLSTGQEWTSVQEYLGNTAESNWDGLSNSIAIVNSQDHINSAAALCLNSMNGGQSDWYLPSIQEFKMLWENYYLVLQTLSQITGATLMQNVKYWSSTARFSVIPISFSFDTVWGNNYSFNHSNYDTLYVRAIRAF